MANLRDFLLVLRLHALLLLVKRLSDKCEKRVFVVSDFDVFLVVVVANLIPLLHQADVSVNKIRLFCPGLLQNRVLFWGWFLRLLGPLAGLLLL